MFFSNNFLEEMKYVKESQEKGGFINMKLNNKSIKIPGYITPITFEGENVTEFLFVPYRGACIHVPPPPSNQIIYVKLAKGLNADKEAAEAKAAKEKADKAASDAKAAKEKADKEAAEAKLKSDLATKDAENS